MAAQPAGGIGGPSGSARRCRRKSKPRSSRAAIIASTGAGIGGGEEGAVEDHRRERARTGARQGQRTDDSGAGTEEADRRHRLHAHHRIRIEPAGQRELGEGCMRCVPVRPDRTDARCAAGSRPAGSTPHQAVHPGDRQPGSRRVRYSRGQQASGSARSRRASKSTPPRMRIRIARAPRQCVLAIGIDRERMDQRCDIRKPQARHPPRAPPARQRRRRRDRCRRRTERRDRPGSAPDPGGAPASSRPWLSRKTTCIAKKPAQPLSTDSMAVRLM